MLFFCKHVIVDVFVLPFLAEINLLTYRDSTHLGVVDRWPATRKRARTAH